MATFLLFVYSVHEMAGGWPGVSLAGGPLHLCNLTHQQRFVDLLVQSAAPLLEDRTQFYATTHPCAHKKGGLLAAFFTLHTRSRLSAPQRYAGPLA